MPLFQEGQFTKDPNKLDPVAQAVAKMIEVVEKKKEETPPEEPQKLDEGK